MKVVVAWWIAWFYRHSVLLVTSLTKSSTWNKQNEFRISNRWRQEEEEEIKSDCDDGISKTNKNRPPSSDDFLLLLDVFKYLITRTDLASIGSTSWFSTVCFFAVCCEKNYWIVGRKSSVGDNVTIDYNVSAFSLYAIHSIRNDSELLLIRDQSKWRTINSNDITVGDQLDCVSLYLIYMKMSTNEMNNWLEIVNRSGFFLCHSFRGSLVVAMKSEFRFEWPAIWLKHSSIKYEIRARGQMVTFDGSVKPAPMLSQRFNLTESCLILSRRVRCRTHICSPYWPHNYLHYVSKKLQENIMRNANAKIKTKTESWKKKESQRLKEAPGSSTCEHRTQA